jgi:hypothetical protein
MKRAKSDEVGKAREKQLNEKVLETSFTAGSNGTTIAGK